MAYLDICGGGYKLLLAPDERKFATELGGEWDGSKRWWKLPPTITAWQVAGIPGITISEKAIARLREYTEKHASLKGIQQLTDAEIRCGEGIDPYQRVGVKFLTTAERALMCDPPGVGKTVQIIRSAQEIEAKTGLFIGKKTLLHNLWNQIRTWELGGITWTVTNYEQIVRNFNTYNDMRFDCVGIDECTYCKNRNAQRTKAVKKLVKKIPFVWPMTGTPIKNRPDELWALLNIIRSDRYTSYWDFVNRYCELEMNLWSGGNTIVGLKAGIEQELSDELADVLIRREKSTIYLPPLTEETITLQLLPEQKKLYDSMRDEFCAFISEGPIERILYAPNALAKHTRLRQIVCSPAILGGTNASVKTQVILDLVEEYAPMHKILIFTTYREYVNILVTSLQKYEAVKLLGGTSAYVQHKAIDIFNTEPSCRVLVGTIGAMGEGHNIQSADLIILADKEWTPDVMDQCISRAWRRGQTNPVHVISLQAQGTVDEHIQQVLDFKESLATEMDRVIYLIRAMKGEV